MGYSLTAKSTIKQVTGIEVTDAMGFTDSELQWEKVIELMIIHSNEKQKEINRIKGMALQSYILTPNGDFHEGMNHAFDLLGLDIKVEES